MKRKNFKKRKKKLENIFKKRRRKKKKKRKNKINQKNHIKVIIINMKRIMMIWKMFRKVFKI